jgi:flagellar biosynthesis/type III secretory pathway chaperone
MNSIATALGELKDALTAFIHLLEQEAAALQDINAETLSGIVAEKNRWSQTANMAWNQLVIACGIDPGRGDSLEGVLSADPEVQVRWNHIRQLVETAGRLNQANSVLINAQMRRTRQALDVLQNAADRGSLYGANGQLLGGFQSTHTLDKA